MIMHLDMDAFFASVEQADNPELRGKPVIIGNGVRGVASTCSYEARALGVHSAMPIFMARQLCPQGVFLPGRMGRYQEVSRAIFDLLQAYTPVIEKASVDECYLEITGTRRLFGPPEVLAKRIQKEILAAFGLTCSIGVAPVKFLAKIASDWRKPAGVTVIKEHAVSSFLSQVPVGRIPGVGSKSMPVFDVLGIQYASDILKFSEDFWRQRLGKRGVELYARAQGRDPSPVIVDSERKSCSAEDTFDQDTTDPGVLTAWLLAQSREVGMALRALGLYGRSITLKLKFDDFSSLTRSTTLTVPTNATSEIYTEACGLLAKVVLSRKVRLIGVGVAHFCEKRPELPFLEDAKKKKMKRLDSAMDAIAHKFGTSSTGSAALLALNKKKRE